MKRIIFLSELLLTSNVSWNKSPNSPFINEYIEDWKRVLLVFSNLFLSTNNGFFCYEFKIYLNNGFIYQYKRKIL